ncbi:unnamed protein product [Anisakis simplex]|uniref:Zinc finger protein unc-98 n=1 Tax=Anisakis simplex TaxID=6269 RepID=A0A0M3K1E4_ANISI|nr:unnamed protein product [Anisakis simplex]
MDSAPQEDSTSMPKDKKAENGDETSAEMSEQNTVVEKVKDDNGMIFYKCRFCGLTFNYMTTLRAHERVHNIDQIPYESNCINSICFANLSRIADFAFANQKGYKCECGRTFHTYTDLLYHKHPGEDDDEETTDNQLIVVNRSGQRIPETEFPIPRFVEKGYEPKHPLKVYSDVRLKPYICQYCSKSYADSRGLSYHMSSHRGERAFKASASRYLMSRSTNSYISSVI